MQCEIHELPSNMPQAWVMAEQLRESPPETAGNLLPGKWEADLGQGGDMNGESHNKACRHRSRTSPSEKDTLRLDMSPGANSGGRSFLPRALPVRLDPIQSCAAIQNIALFLCPPDRCKIWSFLYHLTAYWCGFCCPAQGLRGAGTAHAVE